MEKLVRIVVSPVVWLLWAVLVILWTPPVFLLFVFTVPFDRRRYAVGRFFRICARLALWLNPLWRVRVDGELPPVEEGPYVVVSNHESLADVVIVGALPWEMKWLSKRAILRIPFLGQMMKMAGDVEVRRADEESRARAYDRMKAWLLTGVSVIIFPEGTRSKTGEMLPFRNGAFRMALETGAPVLPLALVGTRDAIRKGSLVFGRARAHLSILDPVPVAGRSREEVVALREEVRALIAARREELEVRSGV